jgi:hypothetical protein
MCFIIKLINSIYIYLKSRDLSIKFFLKKQIPNFINYIIITFFYKFRKDNKMFKKNLHSFKKNFQLLINQSL